MIQTRIFRKVRSASSGTTGSYRNAWQPESVRIIQKDFLGPEDLLRILQNPEMAALLKTLAKAMEK